jgi:hypothetical protein
MPGVMRFPRRLLQNCLRACRARGVIPSKNILLVESASQTLARWILQPGPFPKPRWTRYSPEAEYTTSTSRFGIGQVSGSYRTPAGLHRVAEKHGTGQPIGTSYRGRKPVGLLWDGEPEAPVPHRILWLEGLEPGLNRGGAVDSYARYIYIHGVADEQTLGRAVSAGCIHLAARDLIPLYDEIPCGTLVWIE